MAINQLTDVFIKNLKYDSNAQKKHFDGGGLFLFIKPNGSKLWRWKYYYQGKEKQMSFGIYPQVSLKKAREKRDKCKELLDDGIDPNAHKKAQAAAEQAKQLYTFEAVGREWFDQQLDDLEQSTRNRIIKNLQRDCFAYIGQTPISEITAQQILQVCKRVEARGANEIAHRILRDCGRIMRYAVATCRAEHDVTTYLKGSLKPIKNKHYATITDPKRIGELMRAIDDYKGNYIVACALKMLPLVFVRPGELRKAEWTEIDFEAKEWRVPLEHMKMKREHIVPLSTQVLQILSDLKPVTGDGELLFPSVMTNTRPISDATLTAALRRIGYAKEEIVPHGFRAMASTRLNELGYNRDWIERQLAHSEKNSIRAAYNHAEYLAERREMMQNWADYLDTLKTAK